MARSRRARLGTKLTEAELRAWQALLHGHEQVVGRLDRELREAHGISFGDYDVLLRLARAPDGALRMSALAERVMMPASSLTRVVDRLVERKLVARHRIEEDARAMVARLTAQGRDLLRQAARTHLAGIREHFTGRLEPQQLAAFAEILETITGPHQPH